MARLFFGLDIPERIKAELLQVKDQIAGARWQNDAQLHLTLAFLGEVEAQHVELARDSARGIEHPAFELEASGLGCFGKVDSPKILWAGVSPEDQLRALQLTLSQRLVTSGFTLKNPSFKPHITLSRFRADSGSVSGLMDQHRNTRFGHWTVRDFALFESMPGRRGSVYTILERFSLVA